MVRLALVASFVAASASAQIPGFTSRPIDFPGNASQEAVDPEGNVWIADPTNRVLGKIELSSGKYTTYPVPESNPGLYNIAATRDGSVWYTDYNNPIIGRLSPGGVFTQIPVGGTTLYIAGSPDGGVFFGYFTQPYLGYISPVPGVPFVKLPLPAGTLEEDLTVGPDGAAYFTDLHTNHRIVRMGRDGSVKKFPATVANPPISFTWHPSITTGPDGNMWFTHATAIGRLRLSDGVVTEFPVPYANADPSGISPGGDGNIWVADSFAGAGVVSQLVVSTATDDGHATINASPGIGQPIGILLVAPEPKADSSASSKPFAAASPACPGSNFIVEQNQASGSNLQGIYAPSTSACAELRVKSNVLISPLGTEIVLFLEISNDGPDTADSPNLMIYESIFANDPTVVSFPNWDCLSLGDTLCTRSSSMANGQTDVGEIRFSVPLDVDEAFWIDGFLDSDTPDPTPFNFIAASVGSPGGPMEIVAAPPPAVTPIKVPPHSKLEKP